MHKKFWVGLLLLIGTVAPVWAAKFTFQYNYEAPNIQQVVFANGERIVVAKGRDAIFSETLLRRFKSGEDIPMGVADDYVQIKAAYPDREHAQVAVIVSMCAGSMCSWNDVYVAYIQNDQVTLHKAGTASSKEFRMEIDTAIPKVTAINLDGGKDAYGDSIYESRALMPGKGFLSKSFGAQYLQFAAAHPDKFLSSAKFREPLAKVIGLDNFRELRAAMSGPGSTIIEDGTWLVMTACMAHSCDSNFAAIMIDTHTGKVWAAWVDDAVGIVKYGTTAVWTDQVGGRISSLVSVSDRSYIDYKNGTFKYRLKSK